MTGPCAKQVVTAEIITADGEVFVGTNECLNPQSVCPRAGLPTGVGYELCRDICQQVGHAEIVALSRAGDKAKGASMTLTGHTYMCENCKGAVDAAGITQVTIGG